MNGETTLRKRWNVQTHIKNAQTLLVIWKSDEVMTHSIFQRFV